MASSSSSSSSSSYNKSSSLSSSYKPSVPDDDTILEPSKPHLSTLRCPTTSTRTRPTRDKSGIHRKNMLKKQRGCRRCAECGFWKQSLGFVRSLVKIDSPSFEPRTFKTCNKCSRRRKDLDEDVHFELYGAADVDP